MATVDRWCVTEWWGLTDSRSLPSAVIRKPTAVHVGCDIFRNTILSCNITPLWRSFQNMFFARTHTHTHAHAHAHTHKHAGARTLTPTPTHARAHPHPHPHARARTHTHTRAHTHTHTHTHTHDRTHARAHTHTRARARTHTHTHTHTHAHTHTHIHTHARTHTHTPSQYINKLYQLTHMSMNNQFNSVNYNISIDLHSDEESKSYCTIKNSQAAP